MRKPLFYMVIILILGPASYFLTRYITNYPSKHKVEVVNSTTPSSPSIPLEDWTDRIGGRPRNLCEFAEGINLKRFKNPIKDYNTINISRGNYYTNLIISPFSWNGLNVIGFYFDGLDNSDDVYTSILIKENKETVYNHITGLYGENSMEWRFTNDPISDGVKFLINKSPRLMDGVSTSGEGSIVICQYYTNY